MYSAVLVALALVGIKSALAAPSLSLRVAAPDSVSDVENLHVVATLVNTGDEALRILHDPLSTLNVLPTDTFLITNPAGQRPVFTGVRAKYSLQLAATVQGTGAFTVLDPGQRISVQHDLSRAYNFTVSGAGAYTIEANNRFFIVKASGEIDTIFATKEVVSMKLSGKLGVSRPVERRSLERRAGFVGCSASQQDDIQAAIGAATSYLSGAVEYLESPSFNVASRRYTEWFGTFLESRKALVLQHYKLISSNDFTSFQFDCTCNQTAVFAYVIPNSFGTIHLCSVFWQVPLVGTDSKGGTLVHESSHFVRNGATRDIAYGQAGARQLALSDPNSAVMNADSHEYFAENNPFLP